MPKFRKKPVIVDAEQWFPDKQISGVTRGDAFTPLGNANKGYIYTLEGMMDVTPGDWIITGVKGEKYPCKPDIFEATYELVDNGENDMKNESPIFYSNSRFTD